MNTKSRKQIELECLNHPDIHINDLNSKESHVPKFSYVPVYRGQGVYIVDECREQGIRAVCLWGSVQIFSRRKMPEFLEIVEQSLKAYKETPELRSETTTFYSGRSLMCVMIKSLDLTLVREEFIREVVKNQFLGKIPQTHNWAIFDRLTDMRECMLEKYRLII